MLGHLGAISLKLPNFLTTSQDVTKGADQANWLIFISVRITYQTISELTVFMKVLHFSILNYI